MEEEPKKCTTIPIIIDPPSDDESGDALSALVESKKPSDASYLQAFDLKRKQSTVSKYSIEEFLKTFPPNETVYANDELLHVVGDIIRSDIGLNSEMTLPEKIRKILTSNKFHLIMILLTVLDCVCVVIQVTLDIIHSKKRSARIAEVVVELSSCVILSFFIIEIILKLIFIPKHFIRSKIELFDALIVIISFSLEIVSLLKHDQIHAIEAAVNTFRFWRVVRIANGIVLTLQKQVYHKLEKLKTDISNVLEENSRLESQVSSLSAEGTSTKATLTARTDEAERLKEKMRDMATDNKSLKSKLLERDRQVERLELTSKLLVKDMELQRLKQKLEHEEKLKLALREQQTDFLDRLAPSGVVAAISTSSTASAV